MTSEISQANGDLTEQKAITFHNLKSNYFRVIHADGVWGGVTPHLKVQMVFYNERLPIPNWVMQDISEGKLGKEIDKLSKDGIVREFEAEVLMDLDVAKAFIVWLQEKIDKIDEALGVAEKNKEMAANTDEINREHN